MDNDNNHIIIKNVRCSFPQLYKSEVKEDQTFNPGITVLLDPDKDTKALKEIKDAIKEAIASNPKLKKSPPSGDKLCLREGNRDEYPEGHLMVKAGCAKAPVVLHPNMDRMYEEDNKIYSGCRVNVKIEIWGQANKFGKRVNAKLLAVQFAGDDESFDGSYVSEETAAAGFESSAGTIDDVGEESEDSGSILD